MGAHRRKATVVSLDDAINISGKNAVENSAKQIFKTVSVILTLIRVCAIAPLCSLWTLGLDGYPTG